MPKPKKVELLDEAEAVLETVPVQSEKEKLLELYQTLQNLNIRSISDLENLIARTQ